MPTNSFNFYSPWLKNGDPNTLNVKLSDPNTNPGTFQNMSPGEIGMSFHYNNREYCLVKLHQSATALLVGQLLFWADRNAKTVTNVVANMVNGGTTNAWRNQVAGICMQASTDIDTTNGNLICILTKGNGIPVLATDGAVGGIQIADVIGNVGKTLTVAVGTAPTYFPVGTVGTAVSGGSVVMDVYLPTPA